MCKSFYYKYYSSEEEIISTKVGRQALKTVKKFLEQKEFTTEEDIDTFVI